VFDSLKSLNDQPLSGNSELCDFSLVRSKLPFWDDSGDEESATLQRSLLNWE
jgi:hypothetical protein